MSSIIDSVMEELKKYEVEKVEEVFLTIGELTFLGEEQLRFAFEVLSKGTLLEEAKLTVETEEVLIRCASCQYEGKADYIDDGSLHYILPNLSCPKCGGKIEVTSGRSCLVKSVRVVEK